MCDTGVGRFHGVRYSAFVKTSRLCDTASRAWDGERGTWNEERGTVRPALEIDGTFLVHRLVSGVAYTKFTGLLT